MIIGLDPTTMETVAHAADGNARKMPGPKSAAQAQALNAETWLDEHGDCLYAYAMRRVRDPETAEELVQETLLAALESRDSFAGASTVRTWLVGILKNKILQHFRRVGRKERHVCGELGPDVVDALFGRGGKWRESPGAWGGDPGLPGEDEEFRRVLVRCLLKLPRRVTDAFLLSEQQQLTTENLCQALQTTATNVYAMLYRARTALRDCLERNWFGGVSGRARKTDKTGKAGKGC